MNYVEDEEESQRAVAGRRMVYVFLSLGVLTLALGLTRLGMIPVPNSTANATVMHVPVVLASIFGGPLAGLGVGLVFGTFSWMDASAPIFQNPLVAVVPRVCIGLVAWRVFASLKHRGAVLAAAVAGASGSLTNTVGVLTLAVLLARFPLSAVPGVVPQALMEVLASALVAALAVYVAVRLFKNVRL